jgi:hypothetical protein
MEELCPQALLLNFSNPESRIALALSRYTGLSFAGLCHGLAWATIPSPRSPACPPTTWWAWLPA